MRNRINEGVTTATGWCHYRMPNAVVARFAREPLVSDFLVTHVGCFPRCAQHQAWRFKATDEGILILCTSGKGAVADLQRKSAQPTAVKAGEAVLISAETPHFYAADANDPWSILWFHFKGGRAVSFVQQLGGKRILKGRTRNQARISEPIRRIIELRRLGYSRSVLLECNALGELVFSRLHAEAILAPLAASASEAKPARDANHAVKLHKVTQFLLENYQRDLTIPAVAKQCAVSESWLFHSFPEHVGFSPLGYAIHLRLQEACRLLAQTERKLADIASVVGYEDPFYFSRLFKKHIGQSPDTYRRQFSR